MKYTVEKFCVLCGGTQVPIECLKYRSFSVNFVSTFIDNYKNWTFVTSML